MKRVGIDVEGKKGSQGLRPGVFPFTRLAKSIQERILVRGE